MSSASPREILDTMLGYLGFVVDVREEAAGNDLTLQVYTEEAELLIGRRGDRLDDIQYLLNRILQARQPGAHRVRVDVEHYRRMQEDHLIERIKGIAERVRATGRAVKLDPMNAYYRRILHNAFKDDPDVVTWSPKDQDRMKQITLKPKHPKESSKPGGGSDGNPTP